tara:strand:+ start:6252 stop:7013 length:762 start_codon:yes stop_codon:yes gene_type:complete
MNKFKHIIYTAFNWGWLDSKRTDVNGNPVNTFDWLDRRVELFEKYCLPSITNQTNSDFTWYVLFDKKTPDMYYEKYKDIKNIHISIGDGLDSYIQKEMQANPHLYLLTSRLDNDDGLSTGYVEKLHRVANRFINRDEEKIFINFPNGFAIGTQAFKMWYRSNPFSALLEKVGNPGTLDSILAYQTNKLPGFSGHGSYEKFWKTHQAITDNPMWFHTLHTTNLANSEHKLFSLMRREFIPKYKNVPGFKYLLDY